MTVIEYRRNSVVLKAFESMVFTVISLLLIITNIMFYQEDIIQVFLLCIGMLGFFHFVRYAVLYGYFAIIPDPTLVSFDEQNIYYKKDKIALEEIKEIEYVEETYISVTKPIVVLKKENGEVIYQFPTYRLLNNGEFKVLLKKLNRQINK